MEIYILDGYTQAVILDSGNDSGTSVDRLLLKNIPFNLNSLEGWSGAVIDDRHLFGIARGGENQGPYNNMDFLIIDYFTDQSPIDEIVFNPDNSDLTISCSKNDITNYLNLSNDSLAYLTWNQADHNWFDGFLDKQNLDKQKIDKYLENSYKNPNIFDLNKMFIDSSD